MDEPTGLADAGLRLWHKVTGTFEIGPDEYELLLEACRTADELESLSEALRDAEPTTLGSTGQVRANPLYAEARQHRATLAALLVRLDLPEDEDESPEARWRSDRARDAAKARWAYRDKGLSA